MLTPCDYQPPPSISPDEHVVAVVTRVVCPRTDTASVGQAKIIVTLSGCTCAPQTSAQRRYRVVAASRLPRGFGCRHRCLETCAVYGNRPRTGVRHPRGVVAGPRCLNQENCLPARYPHSSRYLLAPRPVAAPNLRADAPPRWPPGTTMSREWPSVPAFEPRRSNRLDADPSQWYDSASSAVFSCESARLRAVVFVHSDRSADLREGLPGRERQFVRRGDALLGTPLRIPLASLFSWSCIPTIDFGLSRAHHHQRGVSHRHPPRSTRVLPFVRATGGALYADHQQAWRRVDHPALLKFSAISSAIIASVMNSARTPARRPASSSRALTSERLYHDFRDNRTRWSYTAAFHRLRTFAPTSGPLAAGNILQRSMTCRWHAKNLYTRIRRSRALFAYHNTRPFAST